MNKKLLILISIIAGALLAAVAFVIIINKQLESWL
jgi:hypothetical protein